MKRVCVWALAAVVGAAGGCASPAKYVEKQGDSGVVSIPSNTDNWPSHNRREAIALIHKHVGPNYEILEEREVVVGQTTNNNQQVNTEQTVNRTIPFLPAEKQTITNTTTQRDITEWRIAYRRKDAPQPFLSDINTSGATLGLTPAGGQTVQTQYPGAGLVPSVAPSVQPASATIPRGTTGTGSYTMPSRSPGAPAGAADCNH